MGKYIEENLSTNEKVIYEASIHWAIYLPGLISILAAITMFAIGHNTTEHDALLFFSIFLFPIGIIHLIISAIVKGTTELAITSKKLISKSGLIQRDTVELQNKKVEAVVVSQSILGRILGYGTIIATGTGGVKNTFKNIDDPLSFRKATMDILEGIQ